MIQQTDWPIIRKTFADQGYVILESLIDESYFRDIEETYLTFLTKYCPEVFRKFIVEGLLDNQQFHNAFLQLKKDKPRIAGAIYDSIQCSLSILKISIGPVLMDAISQLVNVPLSSIMNFNHGLRMDIPFDQKNTSSWHQDTFNDEAYHDYKVGITAWMPLHHVDSKNGALKICPESHHKRVERKVKARTDPNASLEYYFPQEHLSKFDIIDVEMERGDVLLISMNLVHSSGVNSSTKVRYTVQTRYYPFTDVNFVAGKFIYKSSPL